MYEKWTKCSNFYNIFFRKFNKIPEFHTIFARKCQKFNIIIARKNTCSGILGGGHVPPAPRLLRLWGRDFPSPSVPLLSPSLSSLLPALPSLLHQPLLSLPPHFLPHLVFSQSSWPCPYPEPLPDHRQRYLLHFRAEIIASFITCIKTHW